MYERLSTLNAAAVAQSIQKEQENGSEQKQMQSATEEVSGDDAYCPACQ